MSAKKVYIVDNPDLVVSGRAKRVIAVDDPALVRGGSIQKVYEVTDERLVEQGEAEPVYVVDSLSGSELLRSGRPVPVFFENSLDYTAKTVAMNPIAYWPLIEATPITIADNATGDATLDGTYNDVNQASVAGPMTGEFSGQTGGLFNGYVAIPSGPFDAVWDGSLYTISTWVYINSFISGARVIRIATGTGDAVALSTRTSPAGLIHGVVSGGGPSSCQITFPPAGTWLHVFVTRVQSANEITIALNNGTPVTNTSSGAWGGAVQSATIFASDSTPTNVLDGAAGHLAIFDRLLTDSEREILSTAE